jgi:hypothetical protein
MQPPRFMLKLEEVIEAAEMSSDILTKLEPEIYIQYKPHYHVIEGKFWWDWVVEQCKKQVVFAADRKKEDSRPLLTEEMLAELDAQLSKEEESGVTSEIQPGLYEVYERKRWYLVDGFGSKVWDEQIWLYFVKSEDIVDPSPKNYALETFVVNRASLDRMLDIKHEYDLVASRRRGGN